MGSNVDFPFWLRATHLLNFVLIGMLLRSGIEMLSSLPRLWWRNDCAPGTEWLRFTRRKLPPQEGVYTSLDERKARQALYDIFAEQGLGQATFEMTGSDSTLIVKHETSVTPDRAAIAAALAQAGDYTLLD